MATGRKWRVGGFEGDIWLVRSSPWVGAPDLPSGAEPLGAVEAAAQVSAWFPDGWGDGGDGAMLSEISAALGQEYLWSTDALASGRLKALVRQALRDGRLLAVRVRLAGVGGAVGDDGGEQDARPAEPAAQQEEKTWIEIVLMDDDDPPQPMAFQKYRVELPTGEVRQGMLDAHGRAMIVGIDPGTCQVTFPHLDESAWDPA